MKLAENTKLNADVFPTVKDCGVVNHKETAMLRGGLALQSVLAAVPGDKMVACAILGATEAHRRYNDPLREAGAVVAGLIFGFCWDVGEIIPQAVRALVLGGGAAWHATCETADVLRS